MEIEKNIQLRYHSNRVPWKTWSIARTENTNLKH